MYNHVQASNRVSHLGNDANASIAKEGRTLAAAAFEKSLIIEAIAWPSLFFSPVIVVSASLPHGLSRRGEANITTGLV